MKRANGSGTLLGAAALGGAAIVLGVVTLGAVRGGTASREAQVATPTDAPAEERPVNRTASSTRTAVPEAVQWEEVQLATELAPFEEARIWTGERYRLPGDAVVVTAVEANPQGELAPPPAFEVLGTAASDGGGLAIIRVGTGTPRLAELGQRIEGYEVTSIEGGRVTMKNSDRSINLSVASASTTGSRAEENDREGQARNQGNPANREAGNAARRMGVAASNLMRLVEQGQLSDVFGPGTRVNVNGSEVRVTGQNGESLLLDSRTLEGPPAAPTVEGRMPARRGR